VLLWRRALVLTVAVVVGLLVLEAVAWLVDRDPGRRIHYAVRSGVCCEPDPRAVWRLRPHVDAVWSTAEYEEHSRTSSLGLRGPELAAERPPGTVRILAVGDSFTYGVGVQEEESYPSLVASLLAARGVPAEVLNAGVPGYGFDQTYAAALGRARDLDPDVLIAGIHCTDLISDWDQALYTIDGDRLVALDPRKNWIALQLALYRAAPRLLRRSKAFQLALAALEHRDPFGLLPSRDPAVAREWQRTKIVLETSDLTERGRRDGFRVLAVLMPCKDDIDGESARLYADLPSRLEAAGVPTLDVSAALRAEMPGAAALFFADDIHLNPRGNRVLAERVADYLLGGLLDAAPVPAPGR
jgi:lysophospholipase L1-like esterase